MKTWTLEELVRELKWKVAFNEGQTDLEFQGPAGDTDRHFIDALNESYANELNEAQQVGDPQWFYAIQTVTWPASQVTLELPAALQYKGLISVYDITNADPGIPLWFNSWEPGAAYMWRDRITMQWGSSGPSSAVTLRFTYAGEAAEMREDSDEPILIPNRYRHVLVWSAAIDMRMIADDVAPPQWVRHRDNIRESMMKFLSVRGPLQTGAPAGLNTHPDFQIYV